MTEIEWDFIRKVFQKLEAELHYGTLSMSIRFWKNMPNSTAWHLVVTVGLGGQTWSDLTCDDWIKSYHGGSGELDGFLVDIIAGHIMQNLEIHLGSGIRKGKNPT